MYLNIMVCTIYTQGGIKISYVLIEGEIYAFRVQVSAFLVTGHWVCKGM